MHLTDQPIDAALLAARIQTARRGGVVTFLGHVRNHHGGRTVQRLEYSAYAPMAEAACAEIVREAAERWPVSVELRHRTGELAIGEVAVAVAVAGDHREEAFEACRWIIDEVKRRVPIWKREYYEDGTVAWVDPTAPGGAVVARLPAAGHRA
jgi:molybdopterin synthase catalytic subunit